MRKMVLSTLMIIVGASIGCQPSAKLDVTAEQEKLRSVMEQINTAWETEDLDVFSRLVLHKADMVNFGTDVNDRWVGWDALERGLQEQFEVFSETEVTVRHIDIYISDSGEVAWVAQAMNIKTKFLGSPVDLESRISAVFIKRDADWLLTHFHYSVPISESRSLGM